MSAKTNDDVTQIYKLLLASKLPDGLNGASTTVDGDLTIHTLSGWHRPLTMPPNHRKVGEAAAHVQAASAEGAKGRCGRLSAAC